MTLVFASDTFLQHETGAHPETGRRLEVISSHLTRRILPGVVWRSVIEPASPAILSRVHAQGVIDKVQHLSAAGGGAIDPDTITSAASYHVALTAAGAAISAVDAVMNGEHANALCLLRPPGHHATQHQSMGFCLFNNVAIAAQYALDQHQAKRILIVDWDVHHGNGTQEIFYDRPEVVFFSVHRFPFYPGTGSADENGTGRGRGATVNIPVSYGTSRKNYLAQFQAGLERAIAAGQPDLVIISAGFDAHAADPVGNLGLTTEDYGTLTRYVMDLAATYCRHRIVSCLEGGYNPSALAASVEAHLTGLASVRI